METALAANAYELPYITGDGSQVFDTFYQPAQVLTPVQALAKQLLVFGINERDTEWIEERGSEWVFSFDNCCEMIGVSPGYLRRRLLPLMADVEARKARRARRGGRPSPININDDEIGHKFGGQKHCVKCSRVYHRAYMARKKAGI